ncbi:uncharacterized protein [Struthio camelus]|uniref:uncharacterized protein n=1 Tax=Struthio camelus TaxID=8801 RepID=UPI00360425F0
MSLRKKVRPSSASGKLETFNLSSILTELQGPSAARGPMCRHTQTPQEGIGLQAAAPVSVSDFTEEAREDGSPLPEWLVKEMLKKQQRSYSIGLMENISESTRAQRHFNPAKSLWKGKIEQQMTLEQLQRLNSAFQELEKDGYKSLDVEKFKQIMKKCMSPHSTIDEQVEKLFMKIDCAATGSIQWEKTAKRKPKWVLDFTVMTQYNKLLLGTADRKIQLYELSNFEPYCQISALEAVPLRLDYW